MPFGTLPAISRDLLDNNLDASPGNRCFPQLGFAAEQASVCPAGNSAVITLFCLLSGFHAEKSGEFFQIFFARCARMNVCPIWWPFAHLVEHLRLPGLE
jgi:hypothetical protein